MDRRRVVLDTPPNIHFLQRVRGARSAREITMARHDALPSTTNRRPLTCRHCSRRTASADDLTAPVSTVRISTAVIEHDLSERTTYRRNA